MAAVPIYVWNGTAWQETGPVIPASPIKYQASAPSSPSTGDIWVDSDGDVTTGSQQFQRFRFVASGGETSISGVDANGATLAYTAGTEIVALNGSTLVRGQDYTATNGTSITGLSPALVANDVVEVFSFMAFNVANTYTQSQVDGFISSANAEPGMKLIVPTSVSSGASISSTGAVTFTTQSSVSLNGVFSSTYQNYKIIIVGKGSTTTGLNFRFRNAGVDNSAADNWWTVILTTASAGPTRASNTSATVVDLSTWWDQQTLKEITISSPAVASTEKMLTYSGSARNSTNGLELLNGGAWKATNDTFDGFTVYPGSGTMTGTIRVYGLKN